MADSSLPTSPRPTTRSSGQSSRSLRSTGKKKRPKSGEQDDNSVATAGSASSTSTYNPLPCWAKKQLAQDLEGAGGLRGFDKGKTQALKEICDYRTYTLEQPEFYGKSGSKLRRQVSQKVTKWKKGTDKDYYKELVHYAKS